MSTIKLFLKIIIKLHSDKVTNIYDKKIPKVNSNHTCLAIISLDSALNKDGNYFIQVLLKECKYIEKKVISHITDNLESSTDHSDSQVKEEILNSREEILNS